MEITKQAIVFLGASESSGYGLPKDASYVDKFSKLLQKDNLSFEVINLSYPGASTQNGKDMLHSVLNSTDSIHSIFISLGLSDGVYGVSPNQIYQNLLGMKEQINAKHPEAKIHIMEGEIFQYHALPNLPKSGSKYYLDYKYIYGELSQDKNIKVYPFLMDSFVNQSDYFLSDMVHPNEKGTTVMANLIYTYFIKTNK